MTTALTHCVKTRVVDPDSNESGYVISREQTQKRYPLSSLPSPGSYTDKKSLDNK
jgi:hypothetical protein